MHKNFLNYNLFYIIAYGNIQGKAGRCDSYLTENDRRMQFDDLAQVLNQLGVETSYGSEYSGGRGVAKLAHACYDTLENNKMYAECKNVALAFVDKNGNFAY